jgi:para-nitrobenzyl esterase
MRRFAIVLSALAPACDSSTEVPPAPPAGPSDPLVITTDSGPVRGRQEGDLRLFLGIPYAAPPLDALRFAPPAAPAPWTEPIEAFEHGPACPQDDAELAQDEDCLTLNVYAHADEAVRPVMVFIHGGGLVQGASSLPLYEGSALAAAGDVLLVTINYRLGALGFLATDALAAESGDDSAGNYGLRDQSFALAWVQRNIAAFGGDPANVTIFGESAGGLSVCAHLGSPLSRGLFHRAIIESGGGCFNFPGLRSAALGTPTITRGEEIADAAGCAAGDDATQLSCLRARTPEELIAATTATGTNVFGLAEVSIGLDGVSLVDQPYDLAKSGALDDVPIITGANADEMALFTITTPVPTEEAYQALVEALVPSSIAAELLALYPAADYDSPKDAYITLLSDVVFICPAHAFAAAAQGGAAPSYAYHFTATSGGSPAALGSFHGLELFYLFAHFVDPVTLGPAGSALIDTMQSTWSTFARDGAPPSWPAYDGSDGSILILDEPTSSEPELRDGKCPALQSLGLVPD